VHLLASNPIAPSTIIGGGLFVLFLIIFAETGLLIGFFLPGDTLLLYAGYHTVHGNPTPHLNYWEVVAVGLAGAIAGAQVGYYLGRVGGERLFASPVNQHRVQRTHKILHRFGEGKAVVIARFVPVVRTFMNPALGITKMPLRDFSVWNVVGAVLWVPLIVLLGRFLPKNFPIDLIILGVVVLSLGAAVVEAWRIRRKTAKQTA
jgi:membrane-associated protein